jgi:tRNA1(Val) A37 N6-methylase TrmN6
MFSLPFPLPSAKITEYAMSKTKSIYSSKPVFELTLADAYVEVLVHPDNSADILDIGSGSVYSVPSFEKWLEL